MNSWDAFEYNEARLEIGRLTKENRQLRGLIRCGECTEELGQRSPDGWAAGLCPGCQSELWYANKG